MAKTFSSQELERLHGIAVLHNRLILWILFALSVGQLLLLLALGVSSIAPINNGLAPGILAIIVGIVYVACIILIPLTFYRLSNALGYSGCLFLIFWFSIGQIIPLLNLILCVAISSAATNELSRAGFRVGFLGTDLNQFSEEHVRSKRTAMKIPFDDLKNWYFDLFYGHEPMPRFAEFGTWVCATAELETFFEPPDYQTLLETNLSGSFDVIAIRTLLKKYLPNIDEECETLILRRKLENALQTPFLNMVEEIDDIRTFQGYWFLEELGISCYTDADVVNFLNIYSSHEYSLTPPVDEKVYDEYFPNFEEQIRRVIDWLKTGEILIAAEDDEHGLKTYRYIDQRLSE